MSDVHKIEPGSSVTLSVSATDAGERIDAYITRSLGSYSRNFIQQLIHKDLVKINGQRPKKHGDIVKLDDTIIVQFPERRTILPREIEEDIPQISIIAEHEHFVVINKPAHLVVHPPHPDNPRVALTDWITHTYCEIGSVGFTDRPGIVHRLDRDTSGVMLVARTNHAHTVFCELFRNRKIHKTYYGITVGHPNPSGSINRGIGRHPNHRLKMIDYDPPMVDEITDEPLKVRSALTHYNVVEYFDKNALVQFRPVTGRTHQIRVHAASIGHPLVGDEHYGSLSTHIDRHALHAAEISFIFDGIDYQFSAPFPPDFDRLITKLK